jgi:hypothetical protein
MCTSGVRCEGRNIHTTEYSTHCDRLRTKQNTDYLLMNEVLV